MAKRDDILEVFQKNLKEVLGAWEKAKFDPNASIREMGVDSVDSFQILVTSMQELGIEVFDVRRLESRTLNQIADELSTKERKTSKVKKAKTEGG